jgi:hypothetical protein
MEAKALEQYSKHLERVRKYNEAHKEELNIKSKSYYHNIIKADPEKYKQYLEQKKEYNKKKKLRNQEVLEK